MERLELLNGSAVKPRERQDAELRYLRTVWGARAVCSPPRCSPTLPLAVPVCLLVCVCVRARPFRCPCPCVPCCLSPSLSLFADWLSFLGLMYRTPQRSFRRPETAQMPARPPIRGSRPSWSATGLRTLLPPPSITRRAAWSPRCFRSVHAGAVSPTNTGRSKQQRNRTMPPTDSLLLADVLPPAWVPLWPPRNRSPSPVSPPRPARTWEPRSRSSQVSVHSCPT